MRVGAGFQKAVDVILLDAIPRIAVARLAAIDENRVPIVAGNAETGGFGQRRQREHAAEVSIGNAFFLVGPPDPACCCREGAAVARISLALHAENDVAAADLVVAEQQRVGTGFQRRHVLQPGPAACR